MQPGMEGKRKNRLIIRTREFCSTISVGRKLRSKLRKHCKSWTGKYSSFASKIRRREGGIWDLPDKWGWDVIATNSMMIDLLLCLYSIQMKWILKIQEKISVLLVEGCAKWLIRNYFICKKFNQSFNDFLKFYDLFYNILGIYQYFDTITSFVQCVLQTFLESEESSKKI